MKNRYKPILTGLAIFATLAHQNAFSMIGESEAQMNKRSGSPVSTTPEGFKVYRNGVLEIHAHYTDGIVDNMVYIANKNTSFSEHIISEILCMESSGVAWIVSKNSKPNFRMYSTADGKLHAALYGGIKLTIFTDQFLKQREEQLKK